MVVVPVSMQQCALAAFPKRVSEVEVLLQRFATLSVYHDDFQVFLFAFSQLLPPSYCDDQRPTLLRVALLWLLLPLSTASSLVLFDDEAFRGIVYSDLHLLQILLPIGHLLLPLR